MRISPAHRTILDASVARSTRRERAFTLIELLVVMIIIAILMAVAIPTFLAQKSSAAKTQVLSNIRLMQQAIEACAANNTTGSYGGCVEHEGLWAYEKSLKNLKKCCSDGPPDVGKYDVNGVTGIDTRVLVPTDAMNITGYEVYSYVKDGDKQLWFQLVHWPDGTITKHCGEGFVMPPWSKNAPGGVSGSRMCTNGRW